MDERRDPPPSPPDCDDPYEDRRTSEASGAAAVACVNSSVATPSISAQRTHAAHVGSCRVYEPSRQPICQSTIGVLALQRARRGF